MSNPIYAAIYAAQKHAGQVRRFSGEPYVMHPYRVARMLEVRGFGFDQIIAAMLHDVVEDCGVPLNEIEKIFGSRVAELVAAVTNPENKDELFAQLARASADAATIKLADIIDNCGGYPADAADREAYFISKRQLLPVLQHGDQQLFNQARLILYGMRT